MADFYSELIELKILANQSRLMAENQALYNQFKRIISSNLDKLKNACRDVVQNSNDNWAFVQLTQNDGALMFPCGEVVENVIHAMLGSQFGAYISYVQDDKSNEIMYFLNVEWFVNEK